MTRFPIDVRGVLDEAGWFPGRDVSHAIDRWEISFAEKLSGLPFFRVVRAALREFDGLVLPQQRQCPHRPDPRQPVARSIRPHLVTGQALSRPVLA